MLPAARALALALAAWPAAGMRMSAEKAQVAAVAQEEDHPRDRGDLYVDYKMVASSKSSSILKAEKDIDATITPMPSPDDVGRWISALSEIPATGAAEVSTAVDVGARFALLAYGRNDGQQAVARVFSDKATGEEVAVEIQLHATGNLITSWFKQAHAVLYLYKLAGDGGGVGVVVSYQGSTAGELTSLGVGKTLVGNWTHNLITIPSRLLDGESFKVHTGFKMYKGYIDDRMKLTEMGPLRALLERWSGVSAPQSNLYDWLHAGRGWKWTAFTGHSLGAGLAQIGSADLAGRLHIKESDHRVFMVTFGTPHAGGDDYVKFVAEHVTPHGGIHVENCLDPVTKVGMFFIAGSDPGRRVLLKQAATLDPSAVHTAFTTVSTVDGPRSVVTFNTPLFTVATKASTYKRDLETYDIRKIECEAIDETCGKSLWKSGVSKVKDTVSNVKNAISDRLKKWFR